MTVPQMRRGLSEATGEGQPKPCGERLHGVNGFKARCTQEWGTEHSHSDHTAEEAAARGLAKKIS
jgi:hypothetical protein